MVSRKSYSYQICINTWPQLIYLCSFHDDVRPFVVSSSVSSTVGLRAFCFFGISWRTFSEFLKKCFLFCSTKLVPWKLRYEFYHQLEAHSRRRGRRVVIFSLKNQSKLLTSNWRNVLCFYVKTLTSRSWSYPEQPRNQQNVYLLPEVGVTKIGPPEN